MRMTEPLGMPKCKNNAPMISEQDRKYEGLVTGENPERGCTGYSVPQHTLIGFFAEADEQRLAFANRRRPQVSGWSEQVGCQRVIIRRGLFHVEGNDLLASGHYYLVGGFGQGQCSSAATAVLAGIDNFSFLDAVRLKEPLSLGATVSALAVINPIDFSRHAPSSLDSILGHSRIDLLGPGENAALEIFQLVE